MLARRQLQSPKAGAAINELYCVSYEQAWKMYSWPSPQKWTALFNNFMASNLFSYSWCAGMIVTIFITSKIYFEISMTLLFCLFNLIVALVKCVQLC